MIPPSLASELRTHSYTTREEATDAADRWALNILSAAPWLYISVEIIKKKNKYLGLLTLSKIELTE